MIVMILRLSPMSGPIRAFDLYEPIGPAFGIAFAGILDQEPEGVVLAAVRSPAGVLGLASGESAQKPSWKPLLCERFVSFADG